MQDLNFFDHEETDISLVSIAEVVWDVTQRALWGECRCVTSPKTAAKEINSSFLSLIKLKPVYTPSSCS